MLPDHERKIITILYNFSLKKRRMPTMSELQTKTGLSEDQIWKALLNLSERKAIVFDGKLETIKIDDGWWTLK